MKVAIFIIAFCLIAFASVKSSVSTTESNDKPLLARKPRDLMTKTKKILLKRKTKKKNKKKNYCITKCNKKAGKLKKCQQKYKYYGSIKKCITRNRQTIQKTKKCKEKCKWNQNNCIKKCKTDKQSKKCKEKCKTCVYYKMSKKAEKWIKRNKRIMKIFEILTSKKRKFYLFQKNLVLLKSNRCTQNAMEVYQSLERCNKTVVSRCDNREFYKVKDDAQKCMKQVNCYRTPKNCNLYKEFNRIKRKKKECLDKSKKYSYAFCMQIVRDEVPTILKFCEKTPQHVPHQGCPSNKQSTKGKRGIKETRVNELNLGKIQMNKLNRALGMMSKIIICKDTALQDHSIALFPCFWGQNVTFFTVVFTSMYH